MTFPNDDPDTPIQEETLCQDDFIEWILKSTSEDSEFRVYRTKHYIMVGIDKFPYQ